MRYFLPIFSLSFAVLGSPALGAAVITQAAGGNAAVIQGTVDAFRASLGTLNPNVAGSFGSGRREINWDGVPSGFAAPNNLPANFFNANSPRGAVFTTPGTGFQVSSNANEGPVEFGNLDASYPSTFATFSAQRLFTAIGSNVLDVQFFVPGSNVAAGASGFGSIFTDVDLANVTSMQFFDINNGSLGTFFVPAFSGSESLSFLGVQFNAGERIARVRIISGNTALGAGASDQNGNGRDVVAMDDFIYGEPVAAAIPEPATWALMIAGFGMLGWRARARKGAIAFA